MPAQEPSATASDGVVSPGNHTCVPARHDVRRDAARLYHREDKPRGPARTSQAFLGYSRPTVLRTLYIIYTRPRCGTSERRPRDQ